MEHSLLTRTEAYNTLKGFLGIPKNALLNKKFFTFFYSESYDGFEEKMSKEKMKLLIDENHIAELNRQYYDAQQKGKEVEHIKDDIFSKLREGRKNLVSRSKQSHGVLQ